MNKKDIFYKTRRNVSIISTSIVFLCLFIFVIIFQSIYISNTFKNIDKEILNQKHIVEGEIVKKDKIDKQKNSPINRDSLIIIPNMKPNMIVTIYNEKQGNIVTQNPYFLENKILDFKIEKYNKIVDIKNEGYNFRGIKFNYKEYDISVVMNIDAELQSIKGVKTSLYMSLIVLIFVSIILSKILADWVIKPLKNAYDKQVYFVQDASHEMRTPLAIIKGKLELLTKNLGYKLDDNFEHISKIMTEIRSLEKLNKDLLILSKEDIDSSVNIKEYNLNNFINDISDFYIDLAEIQDKEFNVVTPNDDILVIWDYEKIKRCIVILLENAFKYTKEDGKIDLVFENNNKYIIIKVKDNGIGIKEEDQNRIFDRFFRSNDVRANDISGSGIGLSLLKSISKNLGIKIDLNSKYKEGSEFILTIPKKI